MGESQKQGFQLSFNRLFRVGFQGSKVTSDGGLILVRELDERLGYGELIREYLADSRANNARFSLTDLMRQSVYSRLAGYEDMNDAERVSQDPTFRLIGSEKLWDRSAALTSRLQTFETKMLTEEENFVGLARVNRELIGKAESIRWHYRTVLDMDSTEIPVHGEQEQSSYNKYFESTCYHPLLLSTVRATVWLRNCGPVTCTVPKTGKSFFCRRSNASSTKGRKLPFALTPPLPRRKFTMRWKNARLSTPSAFRPTTICYGMLRNF